MDQEHPMTDDTEARLRRFLADQVLAEEEVAVIGLDDHLLKRGILNSLTLSHLIVHLEQQFGFTVTPAEYNPENFQSLRTICAFVTRKQTGE